MNDIELAALQRYVSYVAYRAHLAGTDCGVGYDGRMTADERIAEAALYTANGFEPERVRAALAHYTDQETRIQQTLTEIVSTPQNKTAASPPIEERGEKTD